ncbi:T9SS type A sorting domain-containing protein [Rubrivirga sp.]|uniref:T9SS type A sorting domain-containing protein n=1 Tax=Rubrivirga sp. TaxID=1885344 RepID=UPI003B524577
MRPLSRAAPLLAGTLLALAPAAQTSDATVLQLSAVEAYAAPLHDAPGSVHVTGRATPVAPVVSGAVHVWATAAPVAAFVPLAEPAPLVARGAGAALEAELPAELALGSAYPNPSASGARIPYELPQAARVRLSVVDVLGREIAVLADGDRPAGWHEASLDARRLAPGLYHVLLRVGSFIGTTRVTVVR